MKSVVSRCIQIKDFNYQLWVNFFHSILFQKRQSYLLRKNLFLFSTWMYKSNNGAKPFFNTAKEQQLKKKSPPYLFSPIELKKNGQAEFFSQNLLLGAIVYMMLYFILGRKFDNSVIPLGKQCYNGELKVASYECVILYNNYENYVCIFSVNLGNKKHVYMCKLSVFTKSFFGSPIWPYIMQK